jgi:hypothetical protein
MTIYFRHEAVFAWLIVTKIPHRILRNTFPSSSQNIFLKQVADFMLYTHTHTHTHLFEHLEEGRGVYRVLVGKPEGKRPLKT